MPLRVLLGIVLARTLGPEGKGALLILYTLTASLAGLLGFGVSSAVAVMIGRQPDRASTLLWGACA